MVACSKRTEPLGSVGSTIFSRQDRVEQSSHHTALPHPLAIDRALSALDVHTWYVQSEGMAIAEDGPRDGNVDKSARRALDRDATPLDREL